MKSAGKEVVLDFLQRCKFARTESSVPRVKINGKVLLLGSITKVLLLVSITGICYQLVLPKYYLVALLAELCGYRM